MLTFLGGLGLTSLSSRLVAPRCSNDRERFFKESNLSQEERVNLYSILQEADLEGVRQIALRHARSFGTFLDRRPIAEYNSEAFMTAQGFLKHHGGRDIIIDAGCGTGMSTEIIAEANPDQLVLGIDRSAVRIARKKDGIVQNAQFIRANLVDVWRLALEHRWVVKKQYVLYPNPYPKKTDLKVSRRESFPKPIAGTISFWSLACTEALAWPRVLPSTATDRRRA
uniref:tRNA (guanine(46)-N(7))-methyltransferase n=1 Tax=Rhodosorus marinus TaxID=101924 RepID=A0A7S2ZE38_9RHOD|mmetsp:Transcript_15890/g.64965  ORF Transcript_15890/g.64965 Transcript_15890/m.64965 type:complete len:225 (+) Transcript_15890:344-1018(+)